METSTSQEASESIPSRDLRSELFQNLTTQFASALNSNDSLPTATQAALIELLSSEVITAADILAAASTNNPEEEEAVDE